MSLGGEILVCGVGWVGWSDVGGEVGVDWIGLDIRRRDLHM